MNFNNKLIYWYLQNKRDLPWRKTKTAYHVWLSEIMLQQTRVAQGLPYFLSFTTNFPTVHDLANASEEKVLKLWQGLGYYSRARNLHYTAKYISATLNGNFPTSYKELVKLKGIGDYTASAIASICFNQPNAVVDGNVYRVLARHFGIHTPINSTEGIKEFKKLAQSLLDTEQPGNYNQAIMEFGALHCKPKNPLCNDCVFTQSCYAYNKQLIDVLPVKEKKIKVKKRYFNYIVPVINNKHTILNERTGKGIWQGLYEFPLVETSKSIGQNDLVKHENFIKQFKNYQNLILFNEKEIVHKLSHQHLYTKFWIIELDKSSEKTIPWQQVFKHPVPVLIDKFLSAFKLSEN